EVVFMDGGSTMIEVAAAIDPDLDLTVVTHSPPVAEVLAGKPGVEIVLIGGRLLKETMTTTGAEAVDAVRGVRAALCLTSPCGLDADAGITAMRAEEAPVKRAMIEGARRTVAVATADKLGTAAPFVVAPAHRLAALVTDASDGAAVAALSRLGVRMVTP
ncbi:MAG TPA: DeoR/GlpR transcriptional regulator, partial [Arenibaculum sp.]|nr:DeoR/GlpR transcriptional regulator [Arenibaculum sp.]